MKTMVSVMAQLLSFVLVLKTILIMTAVTQMVCRDAKNAENSIDDYLGDEMD
jgi:hypothetical protein